MGNYCAAMTKETIAKALCYELALFAIRKWPNLAHNAIIKAVLSRCKPYWAEWKTEQTVKKVDGQAVKLVERWDKEERHHRAQELAAVAEELFPEATVIPVDDAPVPSVMIIREAPASASDGVKALGGELRITYQLERP